MIGTILEHAKQEYPKESCGIIIVYNGKEKYLPCKNIAEDPENNFHISPAEYAKAEDLGEILKIVHSHPKTNPTPSQADLVNIENTQLPWIIVNPLTGQFTETSPSNYRAPLIGRKFSHGTLDCYAIIRDYYSWELGIELPNFNREDYWWEKGQNLYVENYKKAGFRQVNTLQEHDVIIMMAGSSTPNHAAIYLGNNQILHHVQNRLSSRDIYGGYWQKNTWAIVRHEKFL